MSLGNERQELEGAQLLVARRGLHRLEGGQDDRDVEGMRADRFDELGIEAGVDLDLDLREAVPELLEELFRHHGDPEDRRAHAEDARLPSLGEVRARHRSVGELDRLTGVVEEDAAGVGELDSSAIADEELDADGAFELQDLLRETRLGDVEAIGCPPEVELLGDGDEVPELAEINACHRRPSPDRCACVHHPIIFRLREASCQLTLSYDMVEE